MFKKQMIRVLSALGLARVVSYGANRQMSKKQSQPFRGDEHKQWERRRSVRGEKVKAGL